MVHQRKAPGMPPRGRPAATPRQTGRTPHSQPHAPLCPVLARAASQPSTAATISKWSLCCPAAMVPLAGAASAARARSAASAWLPPANGDL